MLIKLLLHEVAGHYVIYRLIFLQIEPGSVAYLDGRLTLCDVVLKVWIAVVTGPKLADTFDACALVLR